MTATPMLTDIDTGTVMRCLRSVWERHATIPDEEWAFFHHQVRGRWFSQGQNLVVQGEQTAQSYWIYSGLVHYFVNKNNESTTLRFAQQNDLIIDLFTPVLEESSPYSIAALEDTYAVVLPQSLLNTLYERHIVWNIIARKFLELSAALQERNELEIMLDEPLHRYRRLCFEHPEIIERTDPQYLASFLRLTPEQFALMRQQEASA